MYFKVYKLVVPVLLLAIMTFGGCSPVPEIPSTSSTASATLDNPAEIPPTPSTMPVTLAYPNVPAELGIISKLPGMIRVIGYNGSDFVTGTVEVSNVNWLPEIVTDNNKVSLTQNATANDAGITNLWKLRISDSKQFDLNLVNEQAEGHWNLTGLPIAILRAVLGSGKNAFTCDEISRCSLFLCELNCGTGDVVVDGILNAACQSMRIQAGEGSLTLRFRGKQLVNGLTAYIKAGKGEINITIPPDIPARVIVMSNEHVIYGEDISREHSIFDDIYTNAAFRNAKNFAVEIEIVGGSGLIYLNPPVY